jgi:hypothetical protein
MSDTPSPSPADNFDAKQAEIKNELQPVLYGQSGKEAKEFQEILDTKLGNAKLTDAGKLQFFDRILADLKNFSTMDSNQNKRLDSLDIADYQVRLNDEVLQLLSKHKMEKGNFNGEASINQAVNFIKEQNIDVEWDDKDGDVFYADNKGNIRINKDWSVRGEKLFNGEQFEKLNISTEDLATYLNSRREEIRAKVEEKENTPEDPAIAKNETPEKTEIEISDTDKKTMEGAFGPVATLLSDSLRVLPASGVRKDGFSYVGKRIKQADGEQVGAFWYYPSKEEGAQFGFQKGKELTAFVSLEEAQTGLENVFFDPGKEVVINATKQETIDKTYNEPGLAFLKKLEAGELEKIGITEEDFETKIDSPVGKDFQVLDSIVKVQEHINKQKIEGLSLDADGLKGIKTEDALESWRKNVVAKENLANISTETENPYIKAKPGIDGLLDSFVDPTLVKTTAEKAIASQIAQFPEITKDNLENAKANALVLTELCNKRDEVLVGLESGTTVNREKLVEFEQKIFRFEAGAPKVLPFKTETALKAPGELDYQSALKEVPNTLLGEDLVSRAEKQAEKGNFKRASVLLARLEKRNSDAYTTAVAENTVIDDEDLYNDKGYGRYGA